MAGEIASATTNADATKNAIAFLNKTTSYRRKKSANRRALRCLQSLTLEAVCDLSVQPFGNTTVMRTRAAAVLTEGIRAVPTLRAGAVWNGA